MPDVKHRKPADGTFSPEGASAWDDSHVLSDVAAATDLASHIADGGVHGNLSIDGYLDFVEQTSISVPEADRARIFSYDDQGNTRLAYILPDSTRVQVARDNIFVVKNTQGAGIVKGQIVYVSGGVGASGTAEVKLARADSRTTIGDLLIVMETIANNGFGRAMKGGKLEDFDTSAFSQGAHVFLSASTAGAMTETAPSYPNYSIQLGTILAANPSNGSMVFWPAGERSEATDSALAELSNRISAVEDSAQNYADELHSIQGAQIAALTLDDLANVSVPSPTDGQVLKWNSAAGQWIADTDLQGGAGGSVTSNEVSAGDASVAAQAASALSQAASVLSVRIDSVANAISNEASVRSNNDSVLNAFFQAEDAALSTRINSVANAVSVVSQALSVLSQANSAAHVSLDGRINSVQSSLSTETSARIAADSALSTAISALSQQLSLQISAMSQALSNATSNRISADNVLSAAIASVHSVLSQRISALSLGALKGNSIASPLSGQVLKYNSAAGQWVNSADATGGGGGSGTQSITSALSQAHASLASVVSVLNDKMSTVSNIEARGRAASNTVSAATLTNIGSLSISVGTAGAYIIEAMVNAQALTSGGFAFGFSHPPTGTAGLQYVFHAQPTPNQGTMSGFGTGVIPPGTAAGQTAACSISIPTINTQRPVLIHMYGNFSAAGTLQLMARGSVAGSGIVMGHGYIKALRIG